MKIAVMNASSQKEKNEALFSAACAAATPHGHQVVNLGVFEKEDAELSYLQIALCAGILLQGPAFLFWRRCAIMKKILIWGERWQY